MLFNVKFHSCTFKLKRLYFINLKDQKSLFHTYITFIELKQQLLYLIFIYFDKLGVKHTTKQMCFKKLKLLIY
jgi:hypothetical protein